MILKFNGYQLEHYMIKRIWLTFISLVLLLGVSFSQRAIVPVKSEFNQYLDYLITSAQYTPDFVFQQPYIIKDSAHNLLKGRINNFFIRKLSHFYKKDEAKFNLGIIDAGKWDKKLLNRYSIDFNLHYVDNHLMIGHKTSINQDYKYDSNFAGDLSEADHWIYGRVNDAFLYAFAGTWTIYIGRQQRNWGPPGEKSLILSDNPYTYDHAMITYQRKKWKLSVLFAQLDEGKFGTFENTDSLISARRYLMGHRLDLNISDKFALGFSEFATYGGPGRTPEFSLFNPLNLYYPVQRNDRKLLNGIWALDLFLKPSGNTAVYVQFLIDDIIVNNDPGVDDRGRYPDRLAINLIMKFADWFREGTHISFSYTKIWNRTYQSKYGWENYHYRNYSLGYPGVSLEEVKLKTQFWNVFPIYVQNEIILGRYGNANITDIFPLVKESFPINPIKKNLVNHFQLKYFISPLSTAFLDVYYRSNVEHYSNRYNDRNRWVVRIGFSYLLNKGFGVN